MAADAGTEHIAFLLVEDFSHIAFACAIEPLRIANLVSGRALYRWSLASEDGRTAICSHRSAILVDRGLEPLPAGDRLFLISGIHVRERVTPRLMAHLRREQRRGVRLGAICSGAYALAMAGLLDGQACAIHWEFHDAFTEAFPDVVLRRSVFVADAPIPTASGGPAATDLMLHLIARAHGADIATAVADQMVYTAVRGDDGAQRISLGARLGLPSEAVRRAIRAMEAHVEDPVSTADLAAQAGISARQLERLFGKHLHCSPKKYYMDLRLQRARNLLMQTDMGISEVALACGFSSGAHFARAYRQTYGVGPAEFRAIRAR
ncbi:GlxA family transcriptional regulator [Paralimibaculum aggregatum]|uniref:GlxA family transcriptional regulator n=1 Tax=Paralimibaculum aggregatum TaxID=3036245 RepID=A0ABQ6LEE1_9RHOB|nr:GlxA family transcriptional regulator [Limibaculum sp. NKW23]GMG81707.1 GlxA family transcriptional regulator [Limibaculum sp. NKW23]